MGVENVADLPPLDPAVVLIGTAKGGNVGPPSGLVDIGVSEAAYLFRVALPGIRKNESGRVKCDIQRDGKVHIEGIMTGVGLLRNSSTVYRSRVQQLCPPGAFSISFRLPGPVDPRLFSPYFRHDGILEVVVMKGRVPLP
ncbi:unnamed protein product [Prunus brigantina]